MKVQGFANNQYNYATQKTQKQPSFGDLRSTAQNAFDKVGTFCDVNSRNGSLPRLAFFLVAAVFLLGGRFIKSRSNDERREVLVRDVPAIGLSIVGAPMMNKALAYSVTKNTGIPIMTLQKGTKGFMGANLASQKQLIDWYSNLGKDALINFSETVDKNGGNLVKAFKKLNLSDKLTAITNATENSAILNAIKDSQTNNKTAFEALESAMKALGTDNNLLKSAKKAQAYVKLAGIGTTAAILGFFLPRLNIVMTRNKYKKRAAQQEQQNQVQQQNQTEKLTIRNTSTIKGSAGVLSFHNANAIKTFHNLLNMVEKN